MERFHFIEQRDHLPAHITGKVRLADSTSPVSAFSLIGLEGVLFSSGPLGNANCKVDKVVGTIDGNSIF